MFLLETGKKHNKLKVDLQNEFNTCNDLYPKNRQGTLMILEKYTNSSVTQKTNSEGTLFAQRGGSINKRLPPYDKNYWENIECFQCLQKDTHNHTAQKLLAIQTVVNKFLTINQIGVSK